MEERAITTRIEAAVFNSVWHQVAHIRDVGDLEQQAADVARRAVQEFNVAVDNDPLYGGFSPRQIDRLYDHGRDIALRLLKRKRDRRCRLCGGRGWLPPYGEEPHEPCPDCQGRGAYPT